MGGEIKGRDGYMKKKNRVKGILKRRGIVGAHLALSLGVDSSRFYRVTNGHERTPWIREAIAKALKLEPRSLWPDYEANNKN